MRTVLNISVPDEMARLVREEVKTGQYASVSEFVRSLVRKWQEEQLLSDVRVSEREYKEGKAKTLKSLRDLR